MTGFAMTLWVWDVAGRATPLAMLAVATLIPRLLMSLFAGVLVDRLNRRLLMVLGTAVSAIATLTMLLLFLGDRLEIWHLYFTGIVTGVFNYMQGLSYTTSISLLMPERHYARASALQSLQVGAALVVAPGAAGVIYAQTGLGSILAIELVMLAIAMVTLCIVRIPQPESPPQSLEAAPHEPIWSQIAFGFRYLQRHAALKALLVFFLVENFVDSACMNVISPMLLARSDNDSAFMGTLYSAFGVGGLLGGALISVWGGPRRRMRGLLASMAVWSLGLVVLAVTSDATLQIGIAVLGGFCMPFSASCTQAIWQSRVEPEVQGRVFASRFLVTQSATPLGAAIAGPLADRFFEPAMQPGGFLAGSLGNIFGVGAGAGMAVQVALFSAVGVGLALGAYQIEQLMAFDREQTVPT